MYTNNCVDCSDASATSSTKCKGTHLLTFGACGTGCVTGCEVCSDGSSCKTCESGKVLSKNTSGNKLCLDSCLSTQILNGTACLESQSYTELIVFYVICLNVSVVQSICKLTE